MGANDRTGSMKYFGSLHWFVIHTKPMDEHRVKNHFEGMEIETLLPLYKNFQYSHGRMSRVINPLFPNHLFAKLDVELHYYKVKWTRGVNRVLRVGKDPIPVSEIVIQMFKNRMGSDGTLKLEDLREGDLVQITSGPLKDFVGAFHKGLSSSGRVRILLNMVGAEVPIKISRW